MSDGVRVEACLVLQGGEARLLSLRVSSSHINPFQPPCSVQLFSQPNLPTFACEEFLVDYLFMEAVSQQAEEEEGSRYSGAWQPLGPFDYQLALRKEFLSLYVCI